jgi:TPR repeat protein
VRVRDPERVRRDVEAALGELDRDARAARLFLAASELAACGDALAVYEARELLRLAGDEGNAYAALEAGLMMLAGRGGPVEADAGLAYVERAAGLGLPLAALTAGGILLLDGARAADGVVWLRRAAAASQWVAFWLLGAAHLRGHGVPVDAAQARVLLAVAAEHGIVDAQWELAQLYDAGIGGARDTAAADRWRRAAAQAGHADACVAVAERHLEQPGGVALALPLLERAADAGSAKAAARLAGLHLGAGDLPYDAAAVERWMARAAALGWDFEAELTRREH